MVKLYNEWENLYNEWENLYNEWENCIMNGKIV